MPSHFRLLSQHCSSLFYLFRPSLAS